MAKGVTLLEILIVLLIMSMMAAFSVPNLMENHSRMVLNKEQQRLYLFLRRLQARVENSTEIWYLIVNRQLDQQNWCITAQPKNDLSCDCFNPHLCPADFQAIFYQPLQPHKTMIQAKAYFPQKLVSFNGIRNSADPACFILQAEQHRSFFFFSNLGRVRFKTGRSSDRCSAGGDE